MSDRNKISRREAVSTAAKVGIAAGIAAVVAGVGGYFGGLASAPEKLVEKTVERTVTSTVPGPERTVTTTAAATTITQTRTETAPATTITETRKETATITERATTTITAVPSPKPEWRVVWSWGCSWFTGYIPSMVGAATICKVLNMEISWEGTTGCVDVKYADFITSKLAGLDPKRDAIVVHYNGLLADACKKALERGIGVFTSNFDDTTVPESKRYRLSYVGQDEYQAGRVNALYIVEKGLLKKGDRACIGMGERGLEAIELRGKGIASVLEEVGCVIDYVTYSYEPANVAPRLEAYYRGHPDVKAFFACDGTMGQGIEAFMKNVGLQPGQIPNVMWDPTEPVLKGIEDGYITGADDQQFYLQGFYPPIIIWLWKNPFTNFMRPVSINVGATIVDKTNFEIFEKFQAACVEQVKALGWFKF